MELPYTKNWICRAWLVLALFAMCSGVSALAQTTTGTASAAAPLDQVSTAKTAAIEEDEEPIVLSPFVVNAAEDRGYQATETLSGTRLRTNLADVGSSISVLTEALLRDINATNNESLLAYVTGAEVGGARGNFSGGFPELGNETAQTALFANPNANTRIRGLTSADNTRNYFITDLPWDGYTVSRVDLLRGPNAILFGLGSPAGIVNVTTNTAQPWNRDSLNYQVDNHGSQRWTLDFNRTMLQKQLSIRGTILHNEQQFQQRPAFADDIRYYGAFSYKPTVLNRSGNTFEVSGNYENGSINSNRPRTTPPADQMSGWWRPAAQGGLNKRVFDPIAQRNLVTSGSPSFDPAIGTYRSNNKVYYNAETGVLRAYQPFNNLGALRPDGTVITKSESSDNGPFPQLANYGGNFVPASWQGWAAAKGLPFGGVSAYKREMLTDPNIFDFYNTLIDGSTKAEWTDWDVFDAALSQTFLNQKVGYNATMFRQRLDRGQYAAMGWSNLLLLDIETRLANGQENPNLGRPYVAEEFRDGSSNTAKSNRDAWRIQGFGEHDFSKGATGFLMRLLGEHRLTATLSKEKLESDYRTQHAWALDPATKAKLVGNSALDGSPESVLFTGFRHYLGGSLLNRASPAGANIPGISSSFFPGSGGPINVTYFDNTWIAGPSVNPSAPWTPPDPNVTSGARLTQSANPANYKGWTVHQGNLITIHSNQQVNGMSARDYLTNNAELKSLDVESQTFTWQGFLWDKSVVGTFGYRKDKAFSYQYRTGDRAAAARADRGADLSAATFNYSNANGVKTDLEVTSKNHSIALHINRLLGEPNSLPVNLSLYYNKATNFQPLAGRRDINGVILPPPQGSTKEYSALIATKNNKFSVRVTKYETGITNATSTASVGNLWALEQNLAAMPSSPAQLMRDFRSGRTPVSQYSGDPAVQARLINEIMPAWFAFEKALKEKFPTYVSGWMGANTVWGTDSNENSGLKTQAPQGFTYTEDNISKGWEVELTANPSPNWRLGANASLTEVMRDNVPGKSFLDVAAFIDDKIMNTAAGLAPIWWHGNSVGGTGGLRSFGPYPWNYRGDYLNIITLNGRSNPEVRKWRANIFTSYDFLEGRLKDLGIGGGYRWEDKSVIGYAPKRLSNGTDTSTNLDAPVFAPATDTVDLWFSYKRKLTAKVNLRLQLNINNVFGENELVPISAGVDPFAIGSIGTITEKSVIPMINTSYYIREGRSWILSSTLEF